MNQRKFFVIITGAALLGLASPVSAQQQMTVTANPSFANWVESTSRTIDSSLKKVNISRSEAGVTYVRFNCGEDGKPRNIATVHSGAFKPELARIGRRVVSRINSLHPLFEGAQPNQLYEAAIIIARDEEELESLSKKVNERVQRENARWAARGAPNPVVSLAIVSGF
ncbi:hypothetical protein [Allopontixanthobacter sp.]|uniref:hypothetical protein n=1 Tax=Allopontixanthobacter sp. TaxID=2906452 RepID=UPI002AB8C83B|nr:hypothetical protein [Allopontixanthobacter sp.]MDZ4308777.1 hypothetical protein [Allopontixanthobacter sp.]